MPRGSIAHQLAESPGGIEGALERIRAAKAAGQEPLAAIALGQSDLAGASRLLGVAIQAIGESPDEDTDMAEVGEAVHTAAQRIEAWLKGCMGGEIGPVFDALDCCTVVCALIGSEITPRNGKTISPTRCLLKLAQERLEAFLDQGDAS